jgi:hypothetical protein
MDYNFAQNFIVANFVNFFISIHLCGLFTEIEVNLYDC